MNLNQIRKLAGLSVLTEAHDDDDDDLSAAEKELAHKAETELKKKGVSVEADLKAADRKDADKAAKKKAAAKPAPAKAEDKPAPAPAAVEKKDEKAAATSAATSKKLHQAIAWLKAHKGAARKDFVAAADAWGMSKGYAGAYYYPLKKRAAGSDVKEMFILLHPTVAKFVLAENRQFSRYQWVSLEAGEGLEPAYFATEAEAKKIARYMSDHKSQETVVERLAIDV